MKVQCITSNAELRMCALKANSDLVLYMMYTFLLTDTDKFKY